MSTTWVELEPDGSMTEDTARPASTAVPDVSVIVPTRNERDNVGPLLDRLHAALQGSATAEVIFVDDSDDDTPEMVRALSRRYQGTGTAVSLVHRSGEERVGGLSGAVIRGFRVAQAPWVVVMDSDLQHPPEVVPQLLRAAMEGDADLVVGSRYTGDGDAAGLSSYGRSLVSQGSGRMAKTLFPRRLKQVTDPMSGLFLVRREALDLDTFNPIGFKILLEIAVRLAPLKVLEVPYVFAARHAGESKTSIREGLRFARHLVRLKSSTAGMWLRMVGVGSVGVTGIAVNTAALWFFHEYAGLTLAIAALMATQVSTTWNFLLTDQVVYRSRRHRRHWLRSFVVYGLVNNLILAARLPVMQLFISALFLDYRVANIATLVLAFAARFAVVDRAIYRGEDSMPKVSIPTPRKPHWLDHQYVIPGLVRIGSQVALPELEYFRVPAAPGPHDIEIRIGEVGAGIHARVRMRAANGVTVYEEHLGNGSSFRVEMGTPLHVTVGPLLAKSPHVLYTNIVEALLRFTAVAKGKILLHSACLDIDGTGVMLSARTDTGKTGTILRLLREQNARFLSDDMTILSTDGVAQSFPKPLTISQHTLRAVQADDLTPSEWRRLKLQSRLHSKEGRGIGMWLARSNLPIMAMNAVVQRIVPPPKYTAGRLVTCITTSSVQVRDLFIIQRSEPILEDLELDEAVPELLENTDDAYGFPPFATFAPTLVMDGMGWDELRAREKAILREALSSGVRVRRLGSNSFNWADRIPQLIDGIPRPREEADSSAEPVIARAG